MKGEDRRVEVEAIDCMAAINGLYAYPGGERQYPGPLTRFEHHLEHCRACYSSTQMETVLGELIKKASKEDAPRKLQSRLRKPD